MFGRDHVLASNFTSVDTQKNEYPRALGHRPASKNISDMTGG